MRCFFNARSSDFPAWWVPIKGALAPRGTCDTLFLFLSLSSRRSEMPLIRGLAPPQGGRDEAIWCKEN